MKLKQTLFIFVIFLLPVVALANLDVTVQPSKNWGKTSTEDIRLLCENVVLHFQEQLSSNNKINGNLNIVQDDNGPIVYYRSDYGGGINDYKIGLSNAVTDYYQWCAMTYEVAHEFCHVLHNFEETSPHSLNRWFQEVLCQTANIWVIQRMSETWKNRPMKPGLEDYSSAFAKYAVFLSNRQERRYIGTASEWLTEWEDKLRAGNYNNLDYDVVTQLSYKLLPVFEDSPEAWNALRQLPKSNGKIQSYMNTWHRNVDSQYKRYVKDISEVMGIKISEPILTDNNFVNLTFTYKDESSLIPINGIEEWDGWRAGIWEKHPDGNITNQPAQYWWFSERNIWSHWMYAHASSVVKYDISNLNAFEYGSYFGLTNPTCGGAASMKMIVTADNIEIYNSDDILLEDHGVYIKFSIPPDTRILTIEIDDLGNNGCDHYVLGEPKLFVSNNSINEESNNSLDCDVNKDGYVDLYDVMIVRSGINGKTSYDTDINNDGITDEVDLHIVKSIAIEAIAAAAPKKRKIKLTTWGAIKSR